MGRWQGWVEGMDHSREGGMVQLVRLEGAVLGAVPEAHHYCIVVGGLGLLVELGTVLRNTDMLVHKLGV